MKLQPRTFVKRTLDYIHKQKLWSRGDSILLSVSGGLDSMVMLDILAKNQGAHGGQLRVLTIDHGIRAESKEEVLFVDTIAKSHGVPCDIVHLDLQKTAHFQERAREERRKIWQRYPNMLIATAHHGTDQGETVLFRLLRGSGLEGLRGILPKREQLIRPLLFAFREEIEAYAEYVGLEWREDPSNTETWRGKVRSLVPTLSKLRQNPMPSLAQSARLLSRDAEFIEKVVQEKWHTLVVQDAISYQKLKKEDAAIQLHVLRRLASLKQCVPHAKQLEAFLIWEPSDGQKLPMASGMELVLQKGHLRFEKIDRQR